MQESPHEGAKMANGCSRFFDSISRFCTDRIWLSAILGMLTASLLFSLKSIPQAAAQDQNFPIENLSTAEVYSTRTVNGVLGVLERRPNLFFHNHMAASTSSAAVFRLKPNELHQSMNGFGASITESCTMNLAKLDQSSRSQLMQNVFSKQTGAGFDFLRLPMGSSDFSDAAMGFYTYDDSPQNKPDPGLTHFSLKRDEKSIQVILDAKKINPALKVMLSPWSPPAWMKNPKSLLGGSLDPNHYQDYANYFIRTIRELEMRGVLVDSLTIQNEPFYANDHYPSMGMSVKEQSEFIRNYLAPLLKKENLSIRIFILDHNYDLHWAVNEMLDDSQLKSQIHGVAYHCYGGNYPDMLKSMERHPEIPTFQTECSGTMKDDKPSGFAFWIKSHAIGATALGGTGSLGWNLCLDEKGGPTNNGCIGCQGLLTIDSSISKPMVSFNFEFRALAQVSRVIESGARRIGVDSENATELMAVAFKNPQGSESFVAWNGSKQEREIHIVHGKQEIDFVLQPNEAASFIWKSEKN